MLKSEARQSKLIDSIAPPPPRRPPMLKSEARQSKLIDLRGTKKTITCSYCKVENAGTVTECYLGIETANVYHGRTPFYPETVLVTCSKCGMKSTLCNGELFTAEDLKDSLEDLEGEIIAEYTDAAKCLSNNLYTPTAMVCRKILMLVAIDRYAPTDKSYEEYVNYLEEKRYITDQMKSWINLIRKHGNDANHKTHPVDKRNACYVFMWVTALLCRICWNEYIDNSEMDGYCWY